MLRTLTARAVVPVALAITGFVVVCCVLLYATVKEDLTRSAIEQEKGVAATVVKSARYTMLNADREGLKNIVHNVGEGHGVDHVRIVNPKGEIAFSSNPAEVGAGRPKPVAASGSGPLAGSRRFINKDGVEVLAITVPIANEAACFNAACHMHEASQKELGTLDIGVSTEPLQENLALMRNRMLLFCFMVLLLTIGGVAALLQKNLFTPIRLLAEYSDRAAAGDTHEQFSHRCTEIRTLAANINGLARQLDEKKKELASARGAVPEAPKGADADR